MKDYSVKENRLALLDAFIAELEREETDKPLVRLLRAFRDKISNLLYLDADWYPQWFHKAFRQVDVTDSGDLDMAFYLLIQDASATYWDAFDKIVVEEFRKLKGETTP